MDCLCRPFAQHLGCPLHLSRLRQDAGLGARAGEHDAFAEKPVMREVTLEYLTELQNKADSLGNLRRWLDAAARCGATEPEMRRLCDALDERYGP